MKSQVQTHESKRQSSNERLTKQQIGTLMTVCSCVQGVNAPYPFQSQFACIFVRFQKKVTYIHPLKLTNRPKQKNAGGEDYQPPILSLFGVSAYFQTQIVRRVPSRPRLGDQDLDHPQGVVATTPPRYGHALRPPSHGDLGRKMSVFVESACIST